MKKILLFASAFALLTGCSKIEQAPESPINQKVDGIVFQASLNAETKGELYQDEVTKRWNMFWYADEDKMDIYYAQITDPTTPAPTWSTTDVKKYKATRSLGEGYFAAVADNQILKFTAGNNLSFRFVYPEGLTISKASDDLEVTLPELLDQKQEELNGSDAVSKIFMTGKLDNVAPKHENHQTIADNLVGMQLTRPFPVAYVKLKNYKPELYGKLVSVGMEILGKKDDTQPTGYDKTNASEINYKGDDAKFNLETKAVTVGSNNHNDGDQYKVLVTIDESNTGKIWKDDAPVYMMMNTVDRSGKTGEWVEVTYTFEKSIVKDTYQLADNYSFEAHELYNMSKGGALDLAARDYMIFEDGGLSTKTLWLNSSFAGKSIASIISGGNIGNIAITAITDIVAESELSEADFTTLEGFTSLVSFTLNKNTSIPAFETDSRTITNLIAPKVTTIDENAFGNATGFELVNCTLPLVSDVTTLTKLTAGGKSSLEHLDISSVETLQQGIDGTLEFQDFVALESVTVKSGVTVRASVFKGCTALTEVKFPEGVENGSINLVGASAFDGCTALTAISISNTDIPANAFNGCTALASVTDAAGEVIVPTTVGANAFKGTDIASIDLSVATEIGASAFEGCDQLTSGTNVFNVDGITVLNNNVFKGCAELTRVSFANVEEVGTGFFENASKLTALSFAKPITSGTIQENSFGTANNITIYLSQDQVGVVAKALTLNTDKEFTFSEIKFN